VADRVGPRTILLLGAVCGGGTMLLLSFQDAHLWRLYLAYALLGTFGSSGVGYTKIIGTLFSKHRGKALAIFGAESTVALATLPLLTNYLNTHFGWRGTYLVFGVIMLALSPMIFFVIRGPGLSEPTHGKAGARVPAPVLTAAPAAAAAAAEPATPVAPVALEGLTPAEIRRDRAFWLIVLAAVLGGGFYAGLNAHIVAAITDKGFTATVAAQALSASTLVGLVGTLAGGFAVDHFRTARIMAVFGLMSAAGGLLFAFASSTWGGLGLLITAMAIQGTAFAAMRPGATYVQTRFVGLRSFGEANAIQIVFQGIAMGITPPLFGMIYERAGSYAPVYWMVIGGAVAGALLYLVMGPYRYRADIGVARPRTAAATTPAR
jgi:MFS family permease